MIEREQILLEEDQVTLLAIHKLIKETNGLPFGTIKHLLKKEISNGDEINEQKIMNFGIEMVPLNPEDEDGMLGDLVRTSDKWSDLLKLQDSGNSLENTLVNHFKGLETKINNRYEEMVTKLTDIRWNILDNSIYNESNDSSRGWEPVCIADAILFGECEGDENVGDIESVNFGWPRYLKPDEQVNVLYALKHMLIVCPSVSWLDFTAKGGEGISSSGLEYITGLGLERCIRYVEKVEMELPKDDEDSVMLVNDILSRLYHVKGRLCIQHIGEWVFHEGDEKWEHYRIAIESLESAYQRRTRLPNYEYDMIHERVQIDLHVAQELQLNPNDSEYEESKSMLREKWLKLQKESSFDLLKLQIEQNINHFYEHGETRVKKFDEMMNKARTNYSVSMTHMLRGLAKEAIGDFDGAIDDLKVAADNMYLSMPIRFKFVVNRLINISETQPVGENWLLTGPEEGVDWRENVLNNWINNITGFICLQEKRCPSCDRVHEMEDPPSYIAEMRQVVFESAEENLFLLGFIKKIVAAEDAAKARYLNVELLENYASLLRIQLLSFEHIHHAPLITKRNDVLSFWDEALNALISKKVEEFRNSNPEKEAPEAEGFPNYLIEERIYPERILTRCKPKTTISGHPDALTGLEIEEWGDDEYIQAAYGLEFYRDRYSHLSEELRTKMFELLVEHLQGIERPLDEEDGPGDSNNFVKARYLLGCLFYGRANELSEPMELTGLRLKSTECYEEICLDDDGWYFAKGRFNMALDIDKIVQETANPVERERLMSMRDGAYMDITLESDEYTYAAAKFNLSMEFFDRALNMSDTPEDRINQLLKATKKLEHINLDMDRKQYHKSQHNNACFHHFICEIKGEISDETTEIIAKSFIEAENHSRVGETWNDYDLIMDIILFVECQDELPEGMESVQELLEIATNGKEWISGGIEEEVWKEMDASLDQVINQGELLVMQRVVEKSNLLKQWLKTHLIGVGKE